MMREYLLFDAFFCLRREVVFREKEKGAAPKCDLVQPLVKLLNRNKC